MDTRADYAEMAYQEALKPKPMKLLFLDTETTGIDPSHNGVIQIAGIIDIGGEVKEEFNFKCRPFKGESVSQEALRVQKLTKEEIFSRPNPIEIFPELLAILNVFIDRFDKRDKFHMIGQHTKFDYDFMEKWFRLNNDPYFHAYVSYHLIDLIQMSSLFRVAGVVQVPDMKLTTMAAYFGVPLVAHDAASDVRACRSLFYKYVELVKTIPKVSPAEGLKKFTLDCHKNDK